MRVAWLTADYFLDTDEQLISHLQDRFDLTWINLFGGGSPVEARELPGVRHREIVRSPHRARDPRLALDFLRVLRRLRACQPDVVYLNIVGLPYFHFLADVLLPKSKVICAIHNVDDYPGWGNRRFMRFYMDRVYKRFRFFHLFSKHTKTSFLERNPGKTVFYAPLALKSCGEGVRRRDDDKVRFLFFGGIRPNKNLRLLIRTFLRLPQQLRDRAILQVAGSCSKQDQDMYRELAGGDPSIQFDFRRIPDREVPDLFLAHHYLVLPYDHVAQSGPQMIAYNYRLPVIATDLPGFSERIEDGRDGYLFRSGDEEHLTQVIANAIGSHADTYRGVLERLEIRIQQEWEPTVVAEAYESMFCTVGVADQRGGKV
ncbi:MAG: glycosyltransferase family 4 protein [Fibrobacterota bacterium]|nr:glycosyltransferase family 4 protein [Fibrobacterota bacterium]QQS03791.1 MAG: glycosyltransferase family 4 protein [Fibrobacterota bacterium]